MKVVHLHLSRPSAILACILVIGFGVFMAACGGSGGEQKVAVDTPSVEGVQAPASTTPLSEAQQPVETPEAAGDIELPEATDVIETSEDADEQEEPGSSEMIDACSLVTKDEVEAVLGIPVGEPVREDYDGLSICTYDLGEDASVDISVIEHSDEEEAAAFWFQFQKDTDPDEITGYGPVEVSELGYPAYEFYPINNIVVFVGRYELSIDVIDYYNRDQEIEFQRARELVEIALSRMP